MNIRVPRLRLIPEVHHEVMHACILMISNTHSFLSPRILLLLLASAPIAGSLPCNQLSFTINTCAGTSRGHRCEYALGVARFSASLHHSASATEREAMWQCSRDDSHRSMCRLRPHSICPSGAMPQPWKHVPPPTTQHLPIRCDATAMEACATSDHTACAMKVRSIGFARSKFAHEVRCRSHGKRTFRSSSPYTQLCSPFLHAL
jgi:hypothetical protein